MPSLRFALLVMVVLAIIIQFAEAGKKDWKAALKTTRQDKKAKGKAGSDDNRLKRGECGVDKRLIP